MRRNLLCSLMLIVSVMFCKAQISLSAGTWPLTHSDEYKEATVIFTAMNAAALTFQLINFKKAGASKSNAGFGLILGALQITYGCLHTSSTDPYGNAKTLTTVNISMGLVTMITSGIRIFKRDQPKARDKPIAEPL
jgi:hypothetical protein